MGGCHASASITIRGRSMQRLPTVTAALYHILSLMQIMFAGDVLPIEFLYLADIQLLTNIQNLINLLIYTKCICIQNAVHIYIASAVSNIGLHSNTFHFMITGP